MASGEMNFVGVDSSKRLDEFGFNQKVMARFAKFGIFTLGDLERIGSRGLSRLGFVGSSFLSILEKLERGGVNVAVLFDSKRYTDRKMLGALNTPISALFDNSFLIDVLFTNHITRVKHLVSVPDAMLSDMFFKKSVDGYVALSAIQERLAEFGVRVDKNGKIKFDEDKLECIQEPTVLDTPVPELELAATEKAILIKNGFYVLGDILRGRDEVGKLGGFGKLRTARVLRLAEMASWDQDKAKDKGAEGLEK